MDASPSPKRVGLYFGSFSGAFGPLGDRQPHASACGIGRGLAGGDAHQPPQAGGRFDLEEHRLQMVKLALADHPKLRASSVEFDLPRPNYMARTMEHLRAAHPDTAFSIISAKTTWRRFQRARPHGLARPAPVAHLPTSLRPRVTAPSRWDRWMVTPRGSPKSPGHRHQLHVHPRRHHGGHDVQFLLPDAVVAYIGNNHFYEQA